MAINIDWVDVAIVVVLLGGMLMGAREGLVRQALFLGAVYVSTVLAAQYYAAIGGFLFYFFPSSDPQARSLVGFSLVFFGGLIWMSWLSYTAYGNTRISSVATADWIGGGALGLASAVLLACVVLLALTYGFRADWAGIDTTISFIRDQINQSSLASTIFSQVSFLISALRPWLPAGLPALLSV